MLGYYRYSTVLHTAPLSSSLRGAAPEDRTGNGRERLARPAEERSCGRDMTKRRDSICYHTGTVAVELGGGRVAAESDARPDSSEAASGKASCIRFRKELRWALSAALLSFLP